MSSVLTNFDLMALALAIKLKKKRNPRSKWAKQWLLQRAKFSHINLLNELRLEPTDWKNYLRMDEDTYSELLNLVSPLICHQDTLMRNAITPHERLSATLRFLATGRNYSDFKYSSAISPSALSKIIPETCDAIYKVLRKEYLKFPKTEADWKKISDDFNAKWQFPNCLGAVDGKHVRITAPRGSGSYFWNYKKTNSLVLMAIVNANYEFILCDFGTNGRVSDGGVIENTKFFEKLVNDQLNIPPINKDNGLPYVFVGDEAFALRTNFLKPFNQKELNYERRIYNYRLARARQNVENVFGIMASRFRIFHTDINLSLKNIEKVVMACCALHNFLRRKCSYYYTPPSSFDTENLENGEVITGLRPEPGVFNELQRGPIRNSTETAKNVRMQFLKYFNDKGRVPWQDNFVRSH